MNVLKTVLSIGAGVLATAACYLFMSGDKESKKEELETEPQVDNQNSNMVGTVTRPKPTNSDRIIRKLDKLQVGLINFARFVSEVVRAISLFLRAMRCYEVDTARYPG